MKIDLGCWIVFTIGVIKGTPFKKAPGKDRIQCPEFPPRIADIEDIALLYDLLRMMEFCNPNFLQNTG